MGTDIINEKRPSEEFVKEWGATQIEWDHFLAKPISVISALRLLEHRYDSSGCLYGYINGPGFRSFQESEMVLETIEALKDMDKDHSC